MPFGDGGYETRDYRAKRIPNLTGLERVRQVRFTNRVLSGVGALTAIGTKSRLFHLCAIGFWWAWAALIVYLFMFDRDYVVFWTLLLIEVALLSGQVWILSSRNQTRLLYGEVTAMFVALQLLPIASAGATNLMGLDSYYELRATVEIMSSGWNPNLSLLGSVSAYPAVHLFTAQLSMILEAQVFDVARWIGLLAYSVAFLFYLLFARTLFQDPRVIVLSALPVAFMYYFVMGSAFGRNPFSIALYFLTLFLVARNYQSPKIRWTLMILVSATAMLFAHPLAPVVLAAFLVWSLIARRAWIRTRQHSRRLCRRASAGEPAPPALPSLNFTIFVVVTVFAYFVFLGLWSQQVFATTITELATGQPGAPFGTGGGTPIYWRVFLYGQAAVGGAFVVLIMLKMKRKPDFVDFLLLSFAILVTLWSFASYYLRIEFTRFTLFSWPFLLLAGTRAGLETKHRKTTLLLVAALVAVNVAGYFPTTYDRNLAPAQGVWYLYVDPMERAAVIDYNASGAIVGDWYINMAFLYSRNETIHTDTSYFLHGYANASSYSFFYFDIRDRTWIFTRAANPEGYPKVSDQLYASYQETESMQRVYDNGAVEVYAIVPP